MTRPSRAPFTTSASEGAIQASLALARIPEHLRGGIVRYLRDGIIPGSFLQAIISNQLRQACAVADHSLSMGDLKALTTWFMDLAPIASFGSLEKMQAWSNARHAERLKQS